MDPLDEAIARRAYFLLGRPRFMSKHLKSFSNSMINPTRTPPILMLVVGRYGEHRARGVAKHALGSASSHSIEKTLVAARQHDQQVSVLLVCDLLDCSDHVACPHRDRDDRAVTTAANHRRSFSDVQQQFNPGTVTQRADELLNVTELGCWIWGMIDRNQHLGQRKFSVAWIKGGAWGETNVDSSTAYASLHLARSW